MRLISRARWIILTVWVSSWIYFTRYAMLDDALIHLRYASFLQRLHFVTYDGVHPTYGTSSVLYVSILAVLRSFTKTALLPKYVSTACYLLLILLLSQLYRRSTRGVPPRILWLGLLLTSLTPMAIRWLTDGMETSLVVLSTALLALYVNLEEERSSASLASYLAAVLFGALLVFLRIELISLALLASCVLMSTRLRQVHPKPYAQLMSLHATALAVGAVLGIIVMRVMFGSFLPDTALAKSGIRATQTLHGTAIAIGSSITLGIGTAILALLSGLFLLSELIKKRESKWDLISWACANAGFPLVVLLASSRGQTVQGVRYLLWTFYFPTVWNCLKINKLAEGVSRVGTSLRILAWSYVALIVGILPFDWHFAYRAMAGRSNTFKVMRAEHLDRFQGERLIATDVGFISYFTGADVCDLAGLVNGRGAARLSYPERIRRCASRDPQLLFLGPGQAVQLSKAMEIKDWMVCQRVDFTNTRNNDPHYLMIPPTAGAHACPDDVTPVPAGTIIPALAN
jgi:hypothetical protein